MGSIVSFFEPSLYMKVVYQIMKIEHDKLEFVSSDNFMKLQQLKNKEEELWKRFTTFEPDHIYVYHEYKKYETMTERQLVDFSKEFFKIYNERQKKMTSESYFKEMTEDIKEILCMLHRAYSIYKESDLDTKNRILEELSKIENK
jgi:hypothetical protein